MKNMLLVLSKILFVLLYVYFFLYNYTDRFGSEAARGLTWKCACDRIPLCIFYLERTIIVILGIFIVAMCYIL